MSHEAIALVLGITPPTLRKHFERELTQGAYTKRFEALQGMHSAAKRGNVSAAKTYLAGVVDFMAPSPEAGAPAPAPAPAPTAAPPKGKKEQAQAAAKTAHLGTDWDGLLNPGAPLQ